MNVKPVMKRKRPVKGFRNGPPPIFQREYPPFVPRESLPQEMFPTNYAMPPPIPFNTQEIFNRFNKLFDWRLPAGSDNPSTSDQNRNLRDNADRHFSPVNEDVLPDRNPNNLSKRKITDPNDLRNRLDQQYKRFKYSDERDNYQGDRRGYSFDSPHIDYDYSEEQLQRDSMPRNLNISEDSWGDHQFRNDHQLEVPVDPNIRERDFDDRWGVMDGDEVPARSAGRPFDNLPDRMVFNERNKPWPNDRVYTAEEKWAINVEDSGRKVKEHKPERNPPDVVQRPRMSMSMSDERHREYSIEKGTDRHNESFNDSFNDNWGTYRKDYDEPRYHHRDTFDNRNECEAISERDGEPFSGDDRGGLHRMRPGDRPYFPGDFRNTPNKMPPGNEDYYPPNDVMPSCSKNDFPQSYDRGSRHQLSDDDLTVVIYKPDDAKITFADASALRSMLIDLVVNCGNPDQMPEFKRSGITWGSKGFYVICRTQETMDWLLKQNLPPLNGVHVLLRRNRIMETVKISAFAPRCTRSKEEVFKLLKLQNGKKGFNFNNWIMRSYQISPKGVYMAFDVSLEEAHLLDDLGCELSFELKALAFRISPNTVHMVSDFQL